MGFELVGEYMDQLSNMSNSKVSLVGWDKPSISNDNIGKFVFVEHKKSKAFDLKKFRFPSDENKDKLVYFRVCIPKDKSTKPFFDIFCPFSKCTTYNTFLSLNIIFFSKKNNRLGYFLFLGEKSFFLFIFSLLL